MRVTHHAYCKNCGHHADLHDEEGRCKGKSLKGPGPCDCQKLR